MFGRVAITLGIGPHSNSIFFFPRLRLTLDVYHTSTHGVALVYIRMQVRSVLYAARWKYRTQKIAKNLPSRHHRTILSGHIFATKALIDNRKNVLNSNISSTCPDNMVNFGPLFTSLGHHFSTRFASWQLHFVCNNCTQWTTHTYEQT